MLLIDIDILLPQVPYDISYILLDSDWRDKGHINVWTEQIHAQSIGMQTSKRYMCLKGNFPPPPKKKEANMTK